MVVTEVHRIMNVTKGTVYSETLGQITEGEILYQLKDQDVIKVERRKKLEGGTLVSTNKYIITFNTTYVPPMIKLADWHRELVEL